MSVNAVISRFRVKNLHGLRTIDVPIVDNKLIVVGENGTSKSTLANLLFYVLTKQWARLRRYRFSDIEIHINDHGFQITPELLEADREQVQRISGVHRHYPQFLRDLISQAENEDDLERLIDDPFVFRSVVEHGFSMGVVRDLVRSAILEFRNTPSQLQLISRQISELFTSQVLYLPTYRRIEQDLESIFPGAEFSNEIKKVRERIARRGRTKYTELVAFGMEDVERAIRERLGQIKDSVRRELSNLTGTYLRDVLRGVHNKVDLQNLSALDNDTLNSIFARMDETTLPLADQKRLREKVADMAQRTTIQADDKVIAHFLSKLLILYRDQQANEMDVRKFVNVCNGYLTGKKLVYDDVKYELAVVLTEEHGSGDLFPVSVEPLGLKWLSSGEKQIISLFSHIYLTRETFFVIIDEPELSLSVPWQRKFLPDILNTGQCVGLIAVTHSPFVFDNDLEPYIRSIMQFTQVKHV